MNKTVLKNKRKNSRVHFKYPVHGKMNILRDVDGLLECRGKGPGGPNVTVTEDNGYTKTFSTKKIVEL